MFEFEDIIKSANIYLCAKDKSFKYIYCNENVANCLDLDSPKQIVGKTDYDLFREDIAKVYRSGDICVLNGGTFLNIREVHPNSDKTIQILTTKNLIKNRVGQLRGVVISFIDVTDLVSNNHTDIFEYDHKSKFYKIRIGKETEYFTQREYDVFKNILMGYTTSKQIAKQLSLSPRTVEDYIERIKNKFQCTSKYHIVEAAARLGILQQNILNKNNL